jgi:hypothetical protein
VEGNQLKPIARLILRDRIPQQRESFTFGDSLTTCPMGYGGLQDVRQHVERMTVAVEIHTGKRPDPRKASGMENMDQDDDVAE